MRISASLAAFLFLLSFASTLAAQQTNIGYKPAADADSKKTILLKDFHPEPTLHRAAHEIERAKFPVFDVHTHTNDAVGIGDRVDPKEMVERMDRLDIKTIVILAGMWGEKLQTIVDTMVKPYPGRFMVFEQYDWSKINDPNFGQLMVKQLDDSVARGARGLKVLKELGLGVRDASGRLIAIDDPRLDPVWEECGRLGIPVFIHVADPEAFFHPINASNERYEELIEHPDWSFYGQGFPTMQELLAQRDRMFAKHPQTIFVALHFEKRRNLDLVDKVAESIPMWCDLDRSPRRRTRTAATPRTSADYEVSRSRHVRDRRRCERGYVYELLPLARNRGRVFSLCAVSGARPLDGFMAWAFPTMFWRRSTTRTRNGYSRSSKAERFSRNRVERWPRSRKPAVRTETGVGDGN